MRMIVKLGPWTAVCGLVSALLLLAGCGSAPQQTNGRFAEMPGYAGVGAPATGATNAGPVVVANLKESPELIRIGDSLTIIFSDTPQLVPPFEERVKDDGSITLLQNQTFAAAGKARGDLEKEIRGRYVPSYYHNLTVTIKPQDRFYFVGGEVKSPGRQIYLGRMTVIKAIQSCGDFTDWANKKKVKLVHMNGTSQTINVPKAYENPSLDVDVLPGDKIHVPRRIF